MFEHPNVQGVFPLIATNLVAVVYSIARHQMENLFYQGVWKKGGTRAHATNPNYIEHQKSAEITYYVKNRNLNSFTSRKTGLVSEGDLLVFKRRSVQERWVKGGRS